MVELMVWLLSVCLSSVYPSVRQGCIVTKRLVVRDNILQEQSALCCTKFGGCGSKKTFSKSGWMKGVKKVCVFNEKLAILLLITNTKRHTPFHTRWKSSTLDDLETSTMGYPSDAGLFVFFLSSEISQQQQNENYIPQALRQQTSLKWNISNLAKK